MKVRKDIVRALRLARAEVKSYREAFERQNRELQQAYIDKHDAQRDAQNGRRKLEEQDARLREARAVEDELRARLHVARETVEALTDIAAQAMKTRDRALRDSRPNAPVTDSKAAEP